MGQRVGGAPAFDDLLARGHESLTVLDISASAIESAKARLKDRAAALTWLVADITRVELPHGAYDFWHDRAVFHFLGDEAERRRYVAAVQSAVKPGGHVLVATFGPDGPTRCSGLDVVRYTPRDLQAEFDDVFQQVETTTEIHTTPGGAQQQFVYCSFRLRG